MLLWWPLSRPPTHNAHAHLFDGNVFEMAAKLNETKIVTHMKTSKWVLPMVAVWFATVFCPFGDVETIMFVNYYEKCCVWPFKTQFGSVFVNTHKDFILYLFTTDAALHLLARSNQIYWEKILAFYGNLIKSLCTLIHMLQLKTFDMMCECLKRFLLSMGLFVFSFSVCLFLLVVR